MWRVRGRLALALVSVSLLGSASSAASEGPVSGLVHNDTLLRDSGEVVAGDALVEEATATARVLHGPDSSRVLAYQLVRDKSVTWMLVRPSEAVLTFEDRDAAARAKAALQRSPNGLVLADEVPGGRTLLVRLESAVPLAPEAVLDAFLRATGIRPLFAEPNQLVEMEDAQDRQYERGRQPWPHRNRGIGTARLDADIDGNEALSRLIYKTHTAPALREPVIIVIDSGVDVTHPALSKNIWVNGGEIPGNGIDDDGNGYKDDVHGWNFSANNADLSDPSGHGTHVAGIIAAQPDPSSGALRGTAIGSKIIVGKIDFATATVMHVAKAMNYALAEGVTIANLSLTMPASSPAMDLALQDLEKAEGFTVAAAGNAKPGQSPVNLHQTPLYPCMSSYVICVGATDETDSYATFANYGASFWPIGQRGVAIAAPGTAIYSTAPGGGYVHKDGTSMATPMVTGAIAAALRAKPFATRDQIRNRVVRTSDRAVGVTVDQVEGSRRLNLYRALFGRPDEEYSSTTHYCDERLTDPQTGTSYTRSQQHPFANSGEPGIDGASVGGAFTICTVAQMVSIQGDMLDRVFVLKRDLDWKRDVTGGWSYAIGHRDGSPAQFNGVLDGGGHAIVGFDQGLRANAGLIAWLGPRGHVFNMRFRDVRLRGSAVAAVVTPSNHGGRIFNVQAEGTVEGGAAGGLVGGMVGGEVRLSSFEGRVSGSGRVGGLVAQMVGDTSLLSDSTFSGQVVAPFEAGGLVGHAGYRAVIRRSHANVDMPSSTAARNMAGGLVGHMLCFARIENSFAEGDIDATARAGALVGRITNAIVRQSYGSVFLPTDNATTGGAVGEIRDSLKGDTNNYMCTESQVEPPPTVLQEAYFDSFIGGTGNGTGRTPQQLRDPATFGASWSRDVWGVPRGFLPYLDNLPRSTHADY